MNVSVLSCYIAAYAYYQPKRKFLIGQLISALLIIKCAFLYVDLHDSEHMESAMGTIAAGAQILGLGGRIYEIRRAIKMGTTEYIPAVMQFAVAALMAQWFIFGIVTGNKFIAMGSQEKTTDKSSDAPSKNIVEKTSKQQKTAKQAVPPLPSSTSSVSHQTPPSVAEKPPSSLPSHPPPRSMKKKPARTPAKKKLKAN